MANIIQNIVGNFFKNAAPAVQNRKPDWAEDGAEEFPLHGHTENQTSIPEVERWSDASLREINQILPWRAYVADKKGRRFGQRASSKKRAVAQLVPDYRTKILAGLCDLKNKHVLEVGCFEGIHTAGLCQNAAKVTAIDSRVENIVKTIVRTSLLRTYPKVMLVDLEDVDASTAQELSCDIVHHIGVLYHLSDPVAHIGMLKNIVKEGIFLDTHVAPETTEAKTYEAAGRTWKYHYYKESGYADAFSGMKNHAKWLFKDDLIELCKMNGFTNVKVIEERAERNGPRLLLYASRLPIH